MQRQIWLPKNRQAEKQIWIPKADTDTVLEKSDEFQIKPQVWQPKAPRIEVLNIVLGRPRSQLKLKRTKSGSLQIKCEFCGHHIKIKREGAKYKCSHCNAHSCSNSDCSRIAEKAAYFCNSCV